MAIYEKTNSRTQINFSSGKLFSSNKSNNTLLSNTKIMNVWNSEMKSSKKRRTERLSTLLIKFLWNQKIYKLKNENIVKHKI